MKVDPRVKEQAAILALKRRADPAPPRTRQRHMSPTLQCRGTGAVVPQFYTTVMSESLRRRVPFVSTEEDTDDGRVLDEQGKSRA